MRVESTDVLGEHSRLAELGLDGLDPAPIREPGAPLMFKLLGPDGNAITVVEATAP